MNIRDFVKTLDESRADGYKVKLNIKGNLFEDILLFGAIKVVQHEFLLNSGTILFSEPLVEEPKPLTRAEITTILNDSYYTSIVEEYDDDAKGFSSVSSRLDGTNKARNFYGVNHVSGGLTKYGIFKASELLSDDRSLTSFKNSVKQYTVSQGVLFIELAISIKQGLGETKKELFVPLFNKPHIVIPAKGAILQHGDLAIKLSTDVIVEQKMIREQAMYNTKERVQQVNSINFNVIVKIEPNKPISKEYSYDYFITQIQKLCKKQVDTYVLDTKSNYKLIEIKFKEEDRVVELFGFLEEMTGAVLSFRYPTVLTRQIEVVELKYLTYDDVEEEEYETMLDIQQELNKIDESELRAYTEYAQRIKSFFDTRMERIAKKKGIHYQLAIMKSYTRNVRFKNFFSVENDMYIVYHQEMFLTLPTSLNLGTNKHLVADVDEKVRKSFERIVREVSEEYDDLVITNSIIKTAINDGKYVSTFLLTWQYDKQFLTYDTDVTVPLTKVIDRLTQRFKTLKK